MRYFIYTTKLNKKAISLREFADEVQKRYTFENICKTYIKYSFSVSYISYYILYPPQ